MTELALTTTTTFADVIKSYFPVRVLQLPFDVPPLETYLYWHESTDRDQANTWMREMILDIGSALR